MKPTFFFTASLAVALLAGAPAWAQSVAKADADFMEAAAHAGNAEIAAGKVAQTKARTPEVKAFAAQMVTDHTKTAEELKQLAASKKVSLPAKPSLMQTTRMKLINAGDNDKFDDRYARVFGVEAHEETVKLFQTAASEAKDAEVKAWAQKTLPALQHHLEMARTLASQTAATTGAATPANPMNKASAAP